MYAPAPVLSATAASLAHHRSGRLLSAPIPPAIFYPRPSLSRLIENERPSGLAVGRCTVMLGPQAGGLRVRRARPVLYRQQGARSGGAGRGSRPQGSRSDLIGPLYFHVIARWAGRTGDPPPSPGFGAVWSIAAPHLGQPPRPGSPRGPQYSCSGPLGTFVNTRCMNFLKKKNTKFFFFTF